MASDHTLVFQVNPNREQLCPEQAHRPRIRGTAWQLTRQPALALTRVIVTEQMSSARVPAIPYSLTQLETHVRIMPNVANISRLAPVLCYQPELVSKTSIPHWRAPWPPRLPSCRFKQGISGQWQTNRQGQLDWRVQKIFLKRVNDLMLHFVIGSQLALKSSHSFAIRVMPPQQQTVCALRMRTSHE